VEGQMAVVGMSIEKSHGDHVTMIHQDETSTVFFEKAIKAFYERSYQLIEVSDLKDELFSLRFQSVTGQLGNHMRIREVKHDIARTKTILRELELKKKSEKIKVTK